MEKYGLNDLREKFLSFFESKGHLRLNSFPLVPHNDNSLLLINSGMAPMKPYFTGQEEPPRRRVATCQKCIRTPDLERVGKTARHGTYFEMLGNFSFGDYFKKESLSWSWEFFTEVLKIPADLLWATIYENDDEAYDIWVNDIGVDPSHIVRLGKEDNFWEHGTGPCGPCSEIHFDRGPAYGCGKPDCKPGCDCDRYMEIWNNVFSQFNNDGQGNYTELAQKNIDTGMGLERLACVMQGVDNMFEVDTVRRILDHVCRISGKEYGKDADTDVSIRIITDHIRSSTFMISDGVLPSNEGRGYVLRRIIRRACRNGKLIGINRPFLAELCETVIAENVAGYPELAEKHDYIIKVLTLEESRFDATIDAGLNILSDLIRAAVKEGTDTISGEEVFKLYDTFGFPPDLTREIAAESSLALDEETFARLMREQKERARNARGNISGWSDSEADLISDLPKTDFTGYTDYRSPAKILAILTDEGRVDSVSEGECTVILDRTPFYGEGGGQVGDTGTIYADANLLNVTDTKKKDGIYLHLCTVVGGSFSVGDAVMADIVDTRRESIRRNHSACHLLQAALRAVLGTHVEQSGSYVDDSRLRFDFTHFAALTGEELVKVERLVNMNILAGNPITTEVTDIETARKKGATALFGEKYGTEVRMVSMGSFSCELCGGTHMDNTAKLGLFKILGESSVAAGIRRIEATTGFGVMQFIDEREALISETAKELKCPNTADLAKRAAQLTGELREARRESERLTAKLAGAQSAGLLASAVSVGAVRVLATRVEGMTVDAVRSMADQLKAENDDLACVLAAAGEDKINFVCACGKAAVAAGAHAGNLAREVAKRTGGGGGGRPDSAMAGGKDASKLDEALSAVADLVKSMLK
ncbi:MAG: alanine--tRNA ligase [Clostridia bacterium]|nr:alanine--tRNA ligase [Clostridia bacterium]